MAGGTGAANAVLAGRGAPGRHAGLETPLFLGHHAASDLNREAWKRRLWKQRPEGQSEAEPPRATPTRGHGHQPSQNGAGGKKTKQNQNSLKNPIQSSLASPC